MNGIELAAALDDRALPNETLAEYLREGNEGKLLIINIGRVPAVENLDQLLAVPDIDAVLVGPHDLSVSMEIPEQYDHPDFDTTVRLIIDKARSRGIRAGIHFWENLEQKIDWARHGADLFLHSADVLLFASALRKELDMARLALGDRTGDVDDVLDAV